MSVREDILKNAYRKLDNLPLSFGIPAYSSSLSGEDMEKYLGGDLNDTLREIRMQSVDNLQSFSYDELQIENRVVYYALRRFRMTASAFFKFSTATDGKSVDKSGIPKMLSEMLASYDVEFKKWKSHFSATETWNRSGSVAIKNADNAT